MCTLAPQGRIDEATVERELKRPRTEWKATKSERCLIPGSGRDTTPSQIDVPDRFDAVQLEEVVRVCPQSKPSPKQVESFSPSRVYSEVLNDSDRLREVFTEIWVELERPKAAFKTPKPPGSDMGTGGRVLKVVTVSYCSARTPGFNAAKVPRQIRARRYHHRGFL